MEMFQVKGVEGLTNLILYQSKFNNISNIRGMEEGVGAIISPSCFQEGVSGYKLMITLRMGGSFVEWDNSRVLKFQSNFIRLP